MEVCVTCGGPHAYYNCTATDGTPYEAHVVVGSQNQGGNQYRPPMDPSYRPQHHYPGPPGFNQNQNVQNRGQNQNRATKVIKTKVTSIRVTVFKIKTKGSKIKVSNIKIKETLIGTMVRVISTRDIFMGTTTLIRVIFKIKVPIRTIELQIFLIRIKPLFQPGLHLTSC